jgi:DNA polymerase I-like protein with 3'-5' exonuclease and polymerase domains
MENPKIVKIAFDLKLQLKILQVAGVPWVRGPMRDPRVAHWLITPEEKVCKCTQAPTYKRTHARTHAHTCTHMYTRIYTHTHIQCKFLLVHTHVHSGC